VPAPNAPDAFAEFVGHDIKTWIKLAQRTGIKLSPCRAAAQAK
jgi:hypothetical protein